MRVSHSFAFLLLSVLFLSSSCLGDTYYFDQLYGFSGNWESTGEIYIPTWSSDGTCTLGSTKYNYAWFNYTFPTEGVRRFSSFEDFDYVNVYKTGFNPANPCQGSAITLVDDGYSVEYTYDAYQWFDAQITYTFVMINYYSEGDFTGKITDAWQGYTTNTTNLRWNPIYTDSYGDCNTEDQGDQAPYYAEMWVNTTNTGYYDLAAFFSRDENGVYPSYTYLALFKGSPNMTLQTDACQSVGDGVELVAATYNSYQYTELVAIRLVAGVTYTAVVSTYNNNFYGPFGLSITPTRRFNFTLPITTTSTAVGGFTEPDRDTSHYGYSCETNDDGYDNRPYIAVNFPVPAGWNHTVRTTEPNDYAFWEYAGNNTNPPTACPLTASLIDYRDSGSYRTYGPYSSDWYTIVATPWSSSSSAAGYYTDIYIIYGEPITSGYTPPATTGNVVSTTSRSSTTSVSGSTSGFVSTTSKSSTTSVTGSTTGFAATTSKSSTTGTVSTTSKSSTTGSVATTSKSSTTTAKATTSSTSTGTLGARVAGAAVFAALLFALLM